MSLASKKTEAERFEHQAQLRGMQSKADTMACSLLTTLGNVTYGKLAISYVRQSQGPAAASPSEGSL